MTAVGPTFCGNCGQPLQSGDQFCAGCGNPTAPPPTAMVPPYGAKTATFTAVAGQMPAPPPYMQYQMPPGRSTNGLAIASLVLGIVWLAGVGSLLAVIFGFVSRKQIRESGGRQTGDGLSIAGIILGFIGILGGIAWIVAIVAVTNGVNNLDNCLNNNPNNTAVCFGNSGSTQGFDTGTTGTSGNTWSSGISGTTGNTGTASNTRTTGSTGTSANTGNTANTR